MAIDKKIANKILANLDEAGKRLEELKASGKFDPRLASALLLEIDTFADKFEVAAFGPKNLQNRKEKFAKVLQKDKDESFMDTFDNPNKILQSDKDEEFMHKVGPSMHSKGLDTFDNDMSSSVTNRDEFQVRDLSEHADGTKKQPSWTGGTGGKSTKQGSTAARVASKSWAP